MMPITTPALSMLNVGRPGMNFCSKRRHELQSEVAVHHRWDCAEQLKRRLNNFAYRHWRKLTQINGNDSSDRQSDRQRNQRRHQRAHYQRENAKSRRCE